MQRRTGLKFAVAALLASTFLLTGQTCDEGTSGQCVPGRVVSCPCADGTDGLQECRSDNTYGRCVCGGEGLADAAGDVDEDDVGTSDALGDAGTDDTQELDTGPESLPYQYVRINSMSESMFGEDPGPDIDAISLTKAGGDTYWAGRVVDEFVPGGPGPEQSAMPDNLLGLPDDVSLQGDTCQLSQASFYSIGHSPGYVTVAFERSAVIEAGDTVTVYEVGNCAGPNGVEPTAEPFAIEVGVYDSGDEWSLVASSATGPVTSYTVTESQLPRVFGD